MNLYSPSPLQISGLLLLCVAFALHATTAHGADITWDGGGTGDSWNTAGNWNPDGVPGTGDDVTVGLAASVTDGQREFLSLTIEAGATVTLATTDTSMLLGRSLFIAGTLDRTTTTGTDVIRLGEATVELTATGRLGSSVEFLDTNGATINFTDGAAFDNPGMNFEHKAANTFGYKLSATGFTTLVANALRSGLGAVWADATYNIDVSDYDIANGTTIVLADYASHVATFDLTFNPAVNIIPGTTGLGGNLSFDTVDSKLVLTLSQTHTSNGTPKTWLDLYNLVVGGNYEAADLIDSDLDGLFNWEEYQLGTNPTGGAPAEDIVVVFDKGTGGAPDTLTFTPPDTQWIIEASTTLDDWGVLPGVTFSWNVDGSITASSAHEALDSRGFFRLVQLGTNNTLVIFLTEGQSNMVGSSSNWGTNIYGIGDLPLRNMFQMSRGHPRAFYDPATANDVIRAYQPLQMTQDHSAWETRRYNSLDFYFAREYAAANPDHDVLIIKNAVGGTGFNNNRWNAGDDLDLLATPYLQAALAQVSGDYATIRFGGILWHQGEADANAAAAYEANLTALVARHRGYVEAEITGSAAPFILGTMVQRWMDERSMNYVVDAVHRDIANLVSNADFADLSDLDQPGWSTTNHFLIDEYKVAGQRYYAKWLAVATAMGW